MFILPIPPSLLWWNMNLFPPLCKEMMTTIVLMRSVNSIMLVWGEYGVRWVWGICGGFRSLMAKCLEPGGTTLPMPVVNIHLLRFYPFQFTPQVREVIAVAYYSIIFFLKRISPLAYCVYLIVKLGVLVIVTWAMSGVTSDLAGNHICFFSFVYSFSKLLWIAEFMGGFSTWSLVCFRLGMFWFYELVFTSLDIYEW